MAAKADPRPTRAERRAARLSSPDRLPVGKMFAWSGAGLSAGANTIMVQQPVRRLVGYARVPLAAGAAARVTFELHTDRFSFTGVSGTRIVEAGEFVLSAGLAETDLPLVASVGLTGDDRDVPEGRTLTTPVTIERT